VATKTKGGTSRIALLLGAVAVVAVAIIVMRVGGNALSGMVTEPIEVEGLDDAARLVELAQGMELGDPNAPVTILEFGDFQCPGCASFATQVKPLIESVYVNEGSAKFVFYDFPVPAGHPNAFLAARASRCAADQGAYWEYHRRLFDAQPAWSASGSPAGLFVRYAGDLELDSGTFESCLRSDQHAATVTAQMQLGVALGVGGTPTVMVSRGEGRATRVANTSFPAIQEAVDALLGGETPEG